MTLSAAPRDGPVPTGAVPPQEAVIFDMDGVVTDTAGVHAAAWQRLFDEVLGDPRLPEGRYAAFDPDTDYLRYVDGRSREEGVGAVLESRGVRLPTGAASDPPGRRTVHGVAARKQEIYRELIAARGVRVFPGTAGLLRRLRAGGVPVGLVTASRNASELLARAGLGDAFDVVVDGQVAAERALPGKPDPAADRFHVTGVMGPDEYHDGYPNAPCPGLRDNAYTGVVSQFAGYDELAELDWGRYRAAYGNIGRLDLILEAKGDSTNRYTLANQADVLMLVYLLGPDELRAVLARLGYALTDEALDDTVAYYLSRTAHGSTLSRVVHASVLASRGGTTGEGVHLGAMAGTIDLVARSFAGQHTSAKTVVFDPCLPEGLRRVAYAFQHRGQRLTVALDRDELRVSADACAANPDVRVRVAGRVETVPGGGPAVFPM